MCSLLLAITPREPIRVEHLDVCCGIPPKPFHWVGCCIQQVDGSWQGVGRRGCLPVAHPVRVWHLLQVSPRLLHVVFQEQHVFANAHQPKRAWCATRQRPGQLPRPGKGGYQPVCAFVGSMRPYDDNDIVCNAAVREACVLSCSFKWAGQEWSAWKVPHC